MIIRKSGKINEVIYEHTTYHNGEYRLYPTIIDLEHLIKDVKEVQSTTEYIRINPFYINGRADMQREYDEYMFYMECRDDFNEKTLKEHIEECLDDELPLSHKRTLGETLYPLCKWDDVETFNLALENYFSLLYEILPELLVSAKNEMKLEDEDLAFGYFCFEVHSE